MLNAASRTAAVVTIRERIAVPGVDAFLAGVRLPRPTPPGKPSGCPVSEP